MVKRTLLALFTLVFVMAAGGLAVAQTVGKQPHILVIWGDDIGYWNISAYNQGMMGYKTPNINRIATERALFTDWYGQQSCTAGRASFITGRRSASAPECSRWGCRVRRTASRPAT